MKTDREDRIKRTEYTIRFPDIDAGRALIIAAVILVFGSFASKLLYDYIQEQRIKRALNEVVLYMDSVVKESEIQMNQAAEVKLLEQHYQSVLTDQERKKQHVARINNAVLQEQNQLLAAKRSSKDCKFWSLQHENNPSPRTAEKRSEFCGFAD